MVAPRWTGLVAARLTRACIVAFCWLFAARAAHAGDPKLVWKTIETEHFVIHYYEPLLDVARRVAASAERSHAVLVPVFDHEPDEKTQIVITDDTDGANGFASVIPRNRIGLYATAPTSLSSLNDHDDWLYALVAHEYTHVLHLDSIGGLPRWINKIVGKTWAPNQVQPRWVIEGIATYQESEQSAGGRIRNSLFDMDLRAVTLADQDHDLDAVTNLPRDWPRGNAAYLYGSHFLKYVFDRYGRDALRELSWSYGSSPIPFGLNRAIREATGHTFEDLYADWRQHLRDKYSIQLEAVERRGRREGRRLTFTAETNRTPRYTLDGQHIVWLQSDGFSPGGFRRMPVGANAGKAQDYASLDRIGEYAMLSDGSMVVEQTNTYRSNYSYHDLYLWDRQTQTMRALTHGLRARDPAMSPDERWVAFVINGESRSRLAVMPLSPHAPHRVLWEGEGRFDQVAAPAWSPDGKVIAFSAWSRGGYRDLWSIDVASGRAQRITHDRAIDIGPVFSPDGAYLYYVSDRSGIYNVYALERGTNRHHQVTNVVGGAVLADVSPDGKRLVYQGFGVGGYDLYEMELDPARWLEPAPYVDDRPEAVEIREDHVAISAPRPYRPLETLAPRNYTVGLLTNSFGSAVNVATNGGDIVGIHSYSLALTLGLDRPGIDIGASYSYGALWPSLRLAAARTTSRRTGVLVDGVNLPYDLDSYGLTASLGLPVLRTARGSGGLSFDYDADWNRVVEDPYQQPDPNDLLPRLARDSRFAGVALRWTYSDARGSIYGVGPQEGQSASASLRLDHPVLGSDARALSIGYRWETYRMLPWSPTSSLAVHVAGGIRTNATGNPGNYSLGGVPEQDVVQSILDSARAGSSGYLRGYARGAVSGRQYHLANIEYRQELLSFERGLATLPVFVRRLHVAGLLDAGNAFSGDFDLRDFKAGVGGSLRLDMIFGYFVPGSLDVGYARGLTSDGIGEYWLLLTGTL
jgi:Tol biopolymer transport system component